MIIGKYQIESDGLQVILSERSIITGKSFGPKKAKPENIGKEKLDTIGYYSNLPNALWGMAQHGINASEMKTIESLIAKMDEIIASIKQVTGKEPSVSINPIGHTSPTETTPETNPLTIPVTRGRGRPKKVLSPEHIAKMQAGRAKRK